MILRFFDELEKKPPPPKYDTQTAPLRESGERGSITNGENYTKYLDELEKLEEDLRVAFVGGIGQGKSSFVNTAYTSMKGRPRNPTMRDNMVDRAAKTGGQGPAGSLTQHAGAYKKKNFPLHVVDVPGLEKQHKEYHATIFRYLFKGRIPDNYKFSPTIPDSSPSDVILEGLTPETESRVCKQVHCVAFVVSAVEFDNGNLDNDTYSNITRITRELDVPSVLIVTKLDRVFPELEEDPMKALSRGDVADLCKSIRTQLGLDGDPIYPVINYHGQARRIEGYENLAMEALFYCAHSAKVFLRNIENWEKRHLSKAAQKARRREAGEGVE